MESSILIRVVLPVSLFIVMLGMGLSLTIKDFKRATQAPKTIGIALFFQLIVLPLVAFAMAKLFGLEQFLAVGLVAIALCPGGVTSNLFSYLAKGNVALSISLTAVVSLVTPFTIPILLGMSMKHFLGASSVIALPLVKTIVTLLVITVVPVGIGMMVNHKTPNFSRKAERIVKVLSVVLLLLIIAGLAKKEWANLPQFFAQVGMACTALIVTTMAIGFWGAKCLGVNKKDSVTIGLEVGIQNGTTGLLITATLLQEPVIAIPSAVYSLIMFGAGGLYAWHFSRGSDDFEKKDHPDNASETPQVDS